MVQLYKVFPTQFNPLTILAISLKHVNGLKAERLADDGTTLYNCTLVMGGFSLVSLAVFKCWARLGSFLSKFVKYPLHTGA